ncbi:uncharacterized protein LOC143181057 [Calliopsis andreniformis]|uniref:uncharacterized protein LOC143181057 n=1 Tax=Calliopsis andreniformis TaxID=337506 RepID=UPI003FCDF163
MDFRNLNDLNVFVNMMSGNLLPVTEQDIKTPVGSKIYAIIVWMIELIYVIVCIIGLFCVPKQKALEDSTVNIVVSLEVILQLTYLYNRKTLIRKIIRMLNYTLMTNDKVLKKITILTVKPLKKIFKVYMIASVSTVVIWTSLPLIEIFKKDEFYYVDYRVPAALSKEPFSITIFIGGILLEAIGSLYAIFKKVSLDLYTIHFMLLITAQYKYLRVKFETILQDENKSLRMDSHKLKQEMKLLTYRYGIVVEIATMMKKLFSPNIGILYINNVFRFCFLSFMIVTSSAFARGLVILYTVGALMQLYVLCFCIQQLLEASTTVFDDAFHGKWYMCDISLQCLVVTMSTTNKLGCKLSRFRNLDLTLPSFMSILNEAYSVCLLFLKSRHV